MRNLEGVVEIALAGRLGAEEGCGGGVADEVWEEDAEDGGEDGDERGQEFDAEGPGGGVGPAPFWVEECFGSLCLRRRFGLRCRVGGGFFLL